ncbi:TrkH family potassium uptake protein [Cryobacterium sp. TMN-39-2]|nr:ATPase [Cryobacterium sp. LW097]POH64063.1 ATPase [Cryobacterium zongtaii]TFC43276.1 TrkH family potassium uptake protein [Cryobacterium sp. TMN-39-2]TFC58711.1 TrkH family potassium uptake protein [Cryobacterium sp. TMB3-1-2]TFC61776.1 TrkH family potassium uptake protein [Cryobacterium sp. TMB1-7]TFC67376.1 TrkH family potassium uptake protein [Cryobacterium sp. TMB3-15]TFC73473.1 TrkH family potassium uptake protein [Cryobacterium sp. TMB3-10]TFC86588.1 TrkH family potassium uptake pro
MHPAQAVAAGFALTILLGTGLLSLPIAKVGPGGASFAEAIFTATSAVCVTGLTVVDTETFWTPFGQVVILVLIQIGGFGVMTFASVIGLAVVRRLSLRSRVTAASEVRSVGLEDVKGLVLGVVTISLIVEGVVAVLLSLRFLFGYGEPLGRAIWFGVFHAVSSFNNAGFALFSDNLISYAVDPFICLPIAAAVILGGLGFPVIVQLRKHLRSPLLWSMNTRIVLAGTITLLVAGTVYITAVEWSNPATLGPMDWPAKILVGFFQSVQTRTAGFNSVDIGAMDSASLLGMDVLMFIGGGPAGTAGGIKITTFAVLYFILVAEIRGDGVVNVFGKRLSRAVHRQAISVVLLAVFVVVASTAVLMVLTDLTLDVLLFEAISAFGTVGLSTGITANLPPAGQAILIMLMFIGRLGPITFASALALREHPVTYELPKERPIIG